MINLQSTLCSPLSYEQISIHKNKVCFSDLFINNLYSIIHSHKNFRRNRADIDIVICIQRSLGNILWPIFNYEKGENVEIGYANFQTVVLQ